MDKLSRAERKGTDGNLCIRIQCWIFKAKQAHSEYVLLLPFTLTIVAAMPLNVTLQVYFLFCQYCVHSSEHVYSNCTHYTL